MGSAKRSGVVAMLATAMAVLAGVAAAWACVPGSGSGRKLTVNPSKLKPGDRLAVSAPHSDVATPVEVRLNAVGGPLLAMLSSDKPAADNGTVTTVLTVPLDTRPGQNVVLAVQQGVTWAPVLLAVAGPDGSVPEAAQSDAAAAARGGSDGAGGAQWLVIVLVGVALGAAAARFTVRARSADRVS